MDISACRLVLTMKLYSPRVQETATNHRVIQFSYNPCSAYAYANTGLIKTPKQYRAPSARRIEKRTRK